MTAPLRTVLVVAAVALALGACGRRGPLEAPPAADAKGQTTKVNESIVDENSSFGATPIGKPPRTNREYTIPKRDFVLDPLL